jgi:hypothetical protein
VLNSIAPSASAALSPVMVSQIAHLIFGDTCQPAHEGAGLGALEPTDVLQ